MQLDYNDNTQHAERVRDMKILARRIQRNKRRIAKIKYTFDKNLSLTNLTKRHLLTEQQRLSIEINEDRGHLMHLGHLLKKEEDD
jgi:hypothetical protein